jgi:hypothetical protein
MIDGDISTKWCDNSGTVPMWITFGFDAPKDINQMVIYHPSAKGDWSGFNTADFEIRVFNTATSAWEVFDAVEDNEAGITYHSLDDGSTVNCDSVMVYVTGPEASGGNVARIHEIEMYNLENVVSVKSSEDFIPVKYEVMQNYPNPFNPTTTIQYSIPSNSKNRLLNVNLSVYDILGKKVKTLVNEVKPSGEYIINFDASGLSSGVYYYQIKTENYYEAKKMIILK